MKKHLKLVISSLIMLSMLLVNTPFAAYATEVDKTDETETVTEEVIDETTKETTEEVVPETTEPVETLVEPEGVKIKDTFTDSYLAQAIADMYTDGDIEGVITAEDIEKTTNLRIRVTAPVSTLAGVEIFKNIDTFRFSAVIPEGEFDGHEIVVEVPDSFATLTKLSNIEINFANLSKFPEIFLQMPQLEMLRLDGTGAHGIPEGISALINLKTFEMANDSIATLPDALFHLPSLRSLGLTNVTLTTIPDAIYSIPNLEILSIAGNMVYTLSPSIANAKKLKSLNAAGCGFSTLPIELTQLENLTDINVSYNSIFNLPLEVYQFVTARGGNGNFVQTSAIRFMEDTPFVEGEEIRFDMYTIAENRIHDIVPSIATVVTVKKMPIIDGEPNYEKAVEVDAEYRYENGQLVIYSLPKLEEETEIYMADIDLYDTNEDQYANPWSGGMMYIFAVNQKDVTAVTTTKEAKKTIKSPSTSDPTTILPVTITGLAALGAVLKLRKKQ